jgi:hypothetical protein
VAARQLGLGQVPPHFFLHHLTASRADLPDIITAQRCYTFFDALAIPIPHDLRFSFTTDGFETWWSMWKTHVFRKALGPLLRELDAEYDIPADQVPSSISCIRLMVIICDLTLSPGSNKMVRLPLKLTVPLSYSSPLHQWFSSARTRHL